MVERNQKLHSERQTVFFGEHVTTAAGIKDQSYVEADSGSAFTSAGILAGFYCFPWVRIRASNDCCATGKSARSRTRGDTMLLTILVVVLLLAALGALPSWPYSRGWGYYPSGGLGLVVVILVILLLLGRI